MPVSEGLQAIMSQRVRSQCVEGSQQQQAIVDAADGWDAGAVWEQRLWVGGLSAARQTQALSAHGITSVLTMAGRLRVWDVGANNGENGPGRPSCIEHYLAIDIADHPCASLFEALPAALDFLDEHLLRSPSGGVLVHCASGVSRSVATCVAWLIMRHSLSLDQALSQVRAGRPLGNPNAGFTLQLQQLERHSASIPDAQVAYEAQLAATGAVSLQEVLVDQRGTANALHARADSVEEAIKSASGEAALITSWREELQQLQRDVDDVVAAFGEHAVQDRPARMITKSAASKVARLLVDVEGMSENLQK